MPDASSGDPSTSTRRTPAGVAADEPRRLWFGVSPRLALRVGIPLAVLLCLVSFAGRLVQHLTDVQGTALFLLDTVNVDGEGGIPAWLSSMLLLACAASLWTVADEVRVRGGRWTFHWRLIAVAFVYLSLDELVSLHERTNAPVGEALDLGGAFHFSWIVLATPLVLAFGLVLLPFLRALPRWTRLAFLVSGAVYVAGAIGMEMVGGLIADSDLDDSVYFAAATLEELLEMVGTLLFLASVNEHRRRHLGALRVGDAAGGPAAVSSHR